MLTNSSEDGLQQPHDEMSTMTLPKKDGTIESAANLVENGQTDLATSTEESKMVASPKFNQALHKIGSFLEEPSKSMELARSSKDSSGQKLISTMDKWNQFKDVEFIIPPKAESAVESQDDNLHSVLEWSKE